MSLFKRKIDYLNAKSLIIYFSRAGENYNVGIISKGNTEVLAKYIKKKIKADIFKVEPLIPYSQDYITCTQQARDRQASKEAPIKKKINDISKYDVIYIGTPVYWETIPEELQTALSKLDFKNKIIRPFVTHEGSGLANVPKTLKNICKNATFTDGLAIQGSKVNVSLNKVDKWIEGK